MCDKTGVKIGLLDDLSGCPSMNKCLDSKWRASRFCGGRNWGEVRDLRGRHTCECGFLYGKRLRIIFCMNCESLGNERG